MTPGRHDSCQPPGLLRPTTPSQHQRLALVPKPHANLAPLSATTKHFLAEHASAAAAAAAAACCCLLLLLLLLLPACLPASLPPWPLPSLDEYLNVNATLGRSRWLRVGIPLWGVSGASKRVPEPSKHLVARILLFLVSHLDFL